MKLPNQLGPGQYHSSSSSPSIKIKGGRFGSVANERIRIAPPDSYADI